MAEYIERDKAIEKINAYCELRQAIYSNDKDEFLRGLQTALKAISYNDVIPNADVQPVSKWMSDLCIVCGRDVRKDSTYYDINGATVCEGCMGVSCKVEKEDKDG